MKVELRNNKGYTQVFIDGQEIHRVVSVNFSESVTSRPAIVLEILPEEIEAEIDNCKVDIVDILEKKKKEDGYKDFVKFLFRGKYGIKEEKDAN